MVIPCGSKVERNTLASVRFGEGIEVGVGGTGVKDGVRVIVLVGVEVFFAALAVGVERAGRGDRVGVYVFSALIDAEMVGDGVVITTVSIGLGEAIKMVCVVRDVEEPEQDEPAITIIRRGYRILIILYTLPKFRILLYHSRKIKKLIGIPEGDVCNLGEALFMNGGEGAHHLQHMSRLAALQAAVGLRRHAGGIGLNEYPLQG